MAVWLVTGATGFVGRHVLESIQRDTTTLPPSEGMVFVVGRRCPTAWPDDRFVATDLTEANEVRRAIEQIKPDFVIHTAGRTQPAPDEELYRANFWATIHLLAALRSTRRPARIVLSGSAAELGSVDPVYLPVDESHVGFPQNVYGRSKWLATSAGLAERAPLEVISARVFNPIGPGTPPSQAFGRFADRLTEPGSDPVDLKVGDLEARRDFVDVRDVARAFITLAHSGRAGLVYNVATGQSHRVGDGLDRLINLSGRAVRVSVDPELKSRPGPADSRAKIDRIVNQTGWQPTISWERSLEDLWREALARNRRPRIDTVAAA
jgi:nucleoside-diphosphate-sugar epimerase